MCHLLMVSPTEILESRQSPTPIWLMFQKCILSLLSGTLNIFSYMNDARIEKPTLPMMYLKNRAVQNNC